MKKIVFFLIAIFSTPGLFAQLDINLNLQPGEAYPLRSRNVINIEQKLLGQPIFTFVIADIKSSYRIVSGDSRKGYKAKVKYDWIIVRMISDNYNIFLNSSLSKQNIQFSQIIKSIENKEFNVEISPKGKIKSIDGLKLIIEDSFMNYMGLVNREIIESTIVRLIGEESLMDYFSELSGVYGNSNLKIGDQWEHSYDIFSGFDARVTTKMTFTNLEDNVVTVIQRGSVSCNDVEQQMMLFSESKVNTELRGTQTGKIFLDLKTGWPLKAYSNQVLRGTVRESSGTNEWEIVINSKSTLKEKGADGDLFAPEM
jgi:hypothetical protein